MPLTDESESISGGGDGSCLVSVSVRSMHCARPSSGGVEGTVTDSTASY